MSKPSIRTGSSSIPQRLAQVGEGVDPALAAVLAPQPVLVEGEARVALGQLAQAALVAALGDPAPRPAAPRRSPSAAPSSSARSGR